MKNRRGAAKLGRGHRGNVAATKMKLDSEFQMPSGEKLVVASGSIVETPLYVRANQSDQDLVTQIDRRQLGLTISLTPYEYEGRWFVRYDVQDADTASGTERRLSCIAAEPFAFVADDSPASIVAQALAEHYQISLFVPAEVGKKQVSGVLRGASLEESLDLLSYFCGASWRKQGAVYYFGGAEPAQFYTFPSAGLDVNVLRTVFGEVTIVGDNVVVKSTPTQYAQLSTVAHRLTQRKVLRVRCSVVDISETSQPAFYDFLKSASLGISKSSNFYQGSISMPTDISVILNFMQSMVSTKMKLDSEFQMPSGEKLVVASGSIVETPLYVRENQSDQDLVTQIDRRQLGLTISLTPYEYEGRWFVRYDVQDADTASGTERRLAVNGSVDLGDGKAVKLASITRDKETAVDKSVPVVSKIPLLGRAFKSKGKATESRVVMVFVQRIE